MVSQGMYNELQARDTPCPDVSDESPGVCIHISTTGIA